MKCSRRRNNKKTEEMLRQNSSKDKEQEDIQINKVNTQSGERQHKVPTYTRTKLTGFVTGVKGENSAAPNSIRDRQK